MIIIKLQDGKDWYKANWVFRQFTEDILATYPKNTALNLIFERALALGGLFVDSMEPEEVMSTLEAMRQVAEGTIQGNIQGWQRTRPEDKIGQQMYLESIGELLALLRKAP